MEQNPQQRQHSMPPISCGSHYSHDKVKLLIEAWRDLTVDLWVQGTHMDHITSAAKPLHTLRWRHLRPPFTRFMIMMAMQAPSHAMLR
jgi:hypothetical protein